MSLRDVVVKVVCDLREAARTGDENDLRGLVLLASAKLEGAMEASVSEVDSGRPSKIVDPPICDQVDCAVRAFVQEAESVQGMRALHGGPFDGDMAPIDGKMPVGAHTKIGGAVYTKRDDGDLHFNAELTSSFGRSRL